MLSQVILKWSALNYTRKKLLNSFHLEIFPLLNQRMINNTSDKEEPRCLGIVCVDLKQTISTIIDDAAHTEIADQYCSVDSSLFKNMIPRGRVGPHWRVQFLLRLGAVYVF